MLPASCFAVVSYAAMFAAYVGDEDNTQVRIIVGATVGAFVVIAVIVIMTLLFLRRWASSVVLIHRVTKKF